MNKNNEVKLKIRLNIKNIEYALLEYSEGLCDCFEIVDFIKDICDVHDELVKQLENEN